MFTTGLSKTGDFNETSWLSANGTITNQRLICVLNTPIDITSIVINNGHYLGGRTDLGA